MVRLTVSFILGVMAAAGSFVLAQPENAQTNEPNVTVVSAVDIDEEVSGKKSKVTTFEVTFGPGAAGRPHRHPGPVFGYVLEGEFQFAVGDGKARTFKAGDTFYEPSMALHRVSRNPSNKSSTRVLAVLVHPRDAKQLILPEPSKGNESP